MAESIGPEPIPADTLRTLAVAELTTMENLLVYLDLDGDECGLSSPAGRQHAHIELRQLTTAPWRGIQETPRLFPRR